MHMSHGDSVVTIVARAYTDAGSRPAFSRQSVSPWRMALPCCTRRLWPTARTSPSTTSAAPMGMPPSASPARASATASCDHLLIVHLEIIVSRQARRYGRRYAPG